MPVSADAGHFDLAADAGSQNTARSIVPWLGHIFVEPVLPRPQMVICGSNPVAVAVADLAKHVLAIDQGATSTPAMLFRVPMLRIAKPYRKETNATSSRRHARSFTGRPKRSQLALSGKGRAKIPARPR